MRARSLKLAGHLTVFVQTVSVSIGPIGSVRFVALVGQVQICFAALNKRAQLWNNAEVFVLVLVLSGAVLAIEKDGKSLAN